MNWKCPYCFREHESADNVKIVYCSGCLNEMKKFPNHYQKKVEVKGDGYRSESEAD